MSRPHRVWVIQCADYTTANPYRSRESAERALAKLEAAGYCRRRHAIVELTDA